VTRYSTTIRNLIAASRRIAAQRRSAMRDDSGQALILALIIILTLAILVPVIGLDVNSESVAVTRASTSEQALAAAEAGIQDYRNYLDNVAGYTVWNYGNTDGNPALNGWASVTGTSNEWFHYIPNSQLQATGGGSNGQMLLEVTGRAGTSVSTYAYRSVVAAFTVSGIVTDSYYSEYELADPAEPGVYGSATVTGTAGPQPLNQIQVEYAYTSKSGAVQYFGPETLLDALCLYHTYDENTFVDSLGSVNNRWVNGGSSNASPTNPYYGPFYDNPSGGITYNVPAQLPNGTIPPNAGDTITIPQAPANGYNTGLCGNYGVGVYPAGVNFNGTAYSNDQLSLCGSASFNGSPPIISGVPDNEAYGDDWPGSVATVSGGKTSYMPLGYTYGFTSNCPNSLPKFGPTSSLVEKGGQQHLPTTTTSLKQYADGTVANGCVYTGPTMIEFVKGGTMNVWSPLSQLTEPDFSKGTAANCGTFTPAQPWQTGLPVPVDSPSTGQSGVIYVEGEQVAAVYPAPIVPNSGYPVAPAVNTSQCSGTSTAPATGQVGTYTCVANSSGNYVQVGQPLQDAVAATATTPAVPAQSCINPYYTNYWTAAGGGSVVTTPANSGVCEEGDAIVEGEVSGQVTVAADNNIIVSRDLTYQCVDGATGGATDVNPGSAAVCNQAPTASALGLIATKELVVAHQLNQPFNSPSCTTVSSSGTVCNTANAPICTDDGTEATQTIANVVPWSCDIDTTFPDGSNGLSIDAAIVALQGSTYVPNFNVGSCLGNLDEQGTNINYFPGFNGSGACQSGTSSGNGYNQVISYDQRLAYDTPPYLLAATDSVWNVTSFVVCGSVNSGNTASPGFQPVTSGAQTYQQIYCPKIS
jgi:hypothetical protein